MRNPWLHCSRLPPGAAAALAALHLSEPAPGELTRLNERGWRAALDFCGRSQITLAVRQRSREAMPAWVQETVDGDLARNQQRLGVVRELYRSLSERLGAVGVDSVALKGLTQCGLFGSEAEERPQYDIDLFMPRETVFAARDALLVVGYEALEGMDDFPTDHLPALIRKTGWEWRGDLFDPEMPLAVELHFQFWNGSLERLAAPGTEAFWTRRALRRVAGLDLPALSAPDALGYACLHLLKHVLRGSARPFHAYEVACFLDARASDNEFWTEWRALHAPELRRLEAVTFRLAREWFGCQLGGAEEEVAGLPAAARAWFDEFALSPATRLFESNKDELWLHLSLLESRRDRWDVARRRLFPGRLPAAVDAVNVPESAMNWRRRLRRRMRWVEFVVTRLLHHIAALASVARSGARLWWRKRHGPG